MCPGLHGLPGHPEPPLKHHSAGEHGLVDGPEPRCGRWPAYDSRVAFGTISPPLESLEIHVTALLPPTLAALGALDGADGKVLATATLALLPEGLSPPSGNSIDQLERRAVAGGDAVFTLRPDPDGHGYQHFQAEFDRGVREYGRPVDVADGFRG
ncbi:hypothetical protein [Streptomyces olivochromogenes]|uniref:Uncharacterized protein n=1 Tax=Streptomyces olivochromogenes TaxID=1963 RepID=A0A250VK86_STROL|nr:hypothetical protein AQJ27_35365 [Streptomyces olivochromogenes]GAX54551.1 hypothetical protein SO3561_06102 [Streptomyces olivochromogenes]